MNVTADVQPDVMHQPGMIFLLIGIFLLCVFATVVSLRNVRLWMLRLAGVATSGVVEALEIVTSENGEVLRRPRVVFTTQTGTPVAAVPLVYRTASPLVAGATVRVSYAADEPERMVVHGFDVRLRDVLYAVLSLSAAIALGIVFALL